MEMSPKALASRLRASHEAVKKVVQRAMQDPIPRIAQAHKGWYRAALNIDRLRSLDTAKTIGVHGIKIEGKCPRGNTGYSLARQSIHQYRKRGIYSDSFEGRVVTITVHEGGLVEVWLRTSQHTLDFPMFDHFCYWLYGKFSGIVLEHTWMLKQLGINVDMKILELDGLQKLSLKNWRNAWFQIYQKGKDVVRAEAHVMPNMKLQDALAVMHHFVQAVNEMQYTPPPEDKNDISYG